MDGPKPQPTTSQPSIPPENLKVRPLLLKRFPQATPEELKQAHANAYAGCIIQDMGYYPFGSQRFSDLVHYVRSGDFVVTLLKDAQTNSAPLYQSR